MKCKTKVFIDNKGNRCVIPSMIIRENDENARSNYDVSSEAHNLTIFTELDLEKDWYEFDDDIFPHVVTELRSHAFLHGYATAYVFDGPLFDKIKKEKYGDK